MSESFSAFGFWVHKPLGPRKSGIPDSVEMPAPVSATIRRDCSIQSRAAWICLLICSFYKNQSVAEPQPKPNIHYGDTESRRKNRGNTKSKAKTKLPREQPRSQRKFRGEWKSMKIFVKGKISKVSNTEDWTWFGFGAISENRNFFN